MFLIFIYLKSMHLVGILQVSVQLYQKNNGRAEYLMSFYLKVRLLVLVLSYGIPSEPCSLKVRLILLLSNRMTSSIHAQYVLSK